MKPIRCCVVVSAALLRVIHRSVRVPQQDTHIRAIARVLADTNTHRSGERLAAAMLTPLAVRPDRQRLGIGARLMDHALGELESRGETLFFVLGHPGYYPRAGFRSALAGKVVSPWPGNPAFMVRGKFVPEGRLVLPSVIADAH